MKRLAVAAMALFLTCGPSRAADNDIAFDLFRQERFAEAAELFTDPAWKGVALYKSGQWWRAAEAFVRANDAESLYNLGNCYAQLGYHALALEAFIGATRLAPTNADAAFNADVMREILDDREKNRGQAGLRPEEREIERRETRDEESGRDDPERGEDSAKGDETGNGDTSGNEQAEDDTATGSRGAAPEQEAGTRKDESGLSQADVDGSVDENAPEGETSGGSEAAETAADQAAAGRRARLEQAQATQQWLNAIRDDPARFLEKRIALEMRRRSANGTLPEPEGDPW